MLDPYLLSLLRQIATGIAGTFGNQCEVVVHDLTGKEIDKSIVLIEHGHVSNRETGDGPSHIVLETLKADPEKLQDKIAYLTKTHSGRILKSSTMYIRDTDGNVVAILAINFDITALLAIDSSIGNLIAVNEDEKTVEEPEDIPLNVNDLLDELIAQSIKLIGKPAALMNKEEKIRAIQFLNNSGAFLVTKSGDKVSQTFGISKYTLYSYIDAKTSDEIEKKE